MEINDWNKLKEDLLRLGPRERLYILRKLLKQEKNKEVLKEIKKLIKTTKLEVQKLPDSKDWKRGLSFDFPTRGFDITDTAREEELRKTLDELIESLNVRREKDRPFTTIKRVSEYVMGGGYMSDKSYQAIGYEGKTYTVASAEATVNRPSGEITKERKINTSFEALQYQPLPEERFTTERREERDIKGGGLEEAGKGYVRKKGKAEIK